MARRRKIIKIKDRPGEQVARALFDELAHGEPIASNGLPDRSPYSDYIDPNEEEAEKYKDVMDDYTQKKRNRILRILHILTDINIIEPNEDGVKSNVKYSITPFGRNLIRGLRIADEMERQNITFKDGWKKLFNDSVELPPEER